MFSRPLTDEELQRRREAARQRHAQKLAETEQNNDNTEESQCTLGVEGITPLN